MSVLRTFLAITALTVSFCHAADPAPRLLFDPADATAASQLSANDTLGDTSFEVRDGGIDVTVVAGGKAGFPGVKIKPSPMWDASGYGHIEATVTNSGTKPIRFTLRVDGDKASAGEQSNASVAGIKPGETKTVSTIFGFTNGKPTYPVDANAVAAALMFIGKSDVEQSFRITDIRAAGPVGEQPIVDPTKVSVKPANGELLGGRASFDPATQLVATGGAKVTMANGTAFEVAFTGANGKLALRPKVGLWNLGEHLQVRLRVKNSGSSPISPRVQLVSRGGPSDVATPAKPIAPGKEAEIILPFVAATPWRGQDVPAMADADAIAKDFHGQEGTGTKYASNTTTEIVILPDPKAPAGRLQVTDVVAGMPPRQPLPAWLGKRPPVDGNWTKTFEDNFDGDAIDLTKWNIYTEGPWHLGKATAYTKDGVIVKDGKLTLRVEKRRAHHNDNPAYPLHEYATGWADSYGKWTQRYGYFEARLKLPTAPNAFTAFWLMPDRGIDFDPKAAGRVNGQLLTRNDTKGEGMEFDIMEHLSAWGPLRHNYGFFWDGYFKFKKATGSMTSYYQPDAEGYLTVGLLWTPGSAILYQQGQERARWETSRIGSLQSYLILQHITGGWETEGVDDSQLPSDLIFDYVRVWQRQDLASESDGPKPNDGGPLPPTRNVE